MYVSFLSKSKIHWLVGSNHLWPQAYARLWQLNRWRSKEAALNYDHKTDMILILSILMSSLIGDVTDCTNKGTPFTHALRTKTSTWIFLFHELWLLNGSSCGQHTANCNHRSHSTQANPSESKEEKIIWWEEIAAFHILQKGKPPACDRFWYRLTRQLSV